MHVSLPSRDYNACLSSVQGLQGMSLFRPGTTMDFSLPSRRVPQLSSGKQVLQCISLFRRGESLWHRPGEKQVLLCISLFSPGILKSSSTGTLKRSGDKDKEERVSETTTATTKKKRSGDKEGRFSETTTATTKKKRSGDKDKEDTVSETTSATTKKKRSGDKEKEDTVSETTNATTKKKRSGDKEKEERVSETKMDHAKFDDKEEEDDGDWPPLVCCFGEALYEFLPSVRISKRQMDPDIYSTWKGLQWSPPEFARLPGSFPSNVAVALAKLGGRVAFMGKVGDDQHGHDLVLKLNTNGVQTRAVKFDSSCSTGVARLRLTNEAGQMRMTCVRPSAENSFVKSEINMDVLKEARLFQFTSFSLTSEPMRSTLFSAIKLAKKNGADILFDVNLPLAYWRSVDASRNLIKEAWKESNIVEVTKHEIEFILDEEYYEELRQKKPEYSSKTIEQTKKRRYHYHYEPEEISPLWHKKMKILFVTDGLFRIHYYTPTFHGSVEGTEDVLVAPFTCDRTGSGDAFIAAIMRKLSSQPELYHDEDKLQKALRFCICAGIIAQWTKGAIRGMPTESAAQNLTEQVFPKHMIF